MSIPILEGKLNDEIVVPCKPTSKTFKVQLIKDGNEVNFILYTVQKRCLEFSIFLLQQHRFESTFQPTDGFRIKLKSPSDGGQYTCHVEFDKAERFDIYFTIEVIRKYEFETKQKIRKESILVFNILK